MTLDRRTLLKLSLAGAAVGTAAATPLVTPALAQAPKKRARWVCLGTKGGPRVGLGRSNPANVLIVDDVPYVVDCGPGVTKRLVEAKVALPDVRYVFVTHLHSDHMLEFGNMVYGGWSAGLNHPVEAFAPVGMEALTRAIGKASSSTSTSASPTKASPIHASCWCPRISRIPAW